MILLALIEDTVRDALAKKTIIGFFSISTFFLLIALLVALTSNPEAILSSGRKNVDSIDPHKMMEIMQAGLTGLLHFGALLLSVFATASIMPSTMEKGAIDLLLSKPVSRAQIIHGRFLGGCIIVLANVAYYVIGMWLILSLTSGYWNVQFLAVIPLVTYSFLVLFTAIMAIGIASGSSALTIIILYVFIYFVSPLLQNREVILYGVLQNETAQAVISGVYYALPKPGAISSIASAVVMHQPFDAMPLWSSALFGVVCYGLALHLFRSKDF